MFGVGVDDIVTGNINQSFISSFVGQCSFHLSCVFIGLLINGSLCPRIERPLLVFASNNTVGADIHP
jgi:hypothetical protein